MPAVGSDGPASQYPMTQAVSGPDGTVVSDVNASLLGVHHNSPDDLDVLLVGPQGQKVMLMSDACGTNHLGYGFWGFDDERGSGLSDAGRCIASQSFSRRTTRSARAFRNRPLPVRTRTRCSRSTARIPTARGGCSSTTTAPADGASSPSPSS